MEVEGHEETLVNVVIFRKARPTAPEVLLAITVVPHFYLVRNASAGLFTENSFPQLGPSMKLVNSIGRRWISRHCPRAMQKKEKTFKGTVEAEGAEKGGAVGP
jgi:hypothetical protein